MARHQSPWTKVTLRIESLENRCVPTTLTPTTFADGGLGSGSLRDAVLQFNADSGTEEDTIERKTALDHRDWCHDMTDPPREGKGCGCSIRPPRDHPG